MINKSKISILLETIKFVRHLQSQIADLKEQMRIAEEKASKRLNQVNEIVASQKINYHVLFLQSPVPMAILRTDGQFVDANSQFCWWGCIYRMMRSLTKSTLESLKTMTLFRFTHPEDLPCAFGYGRNDGVDGVGATVTCCTARWRTRVSASSAIASSAARSSPSIFLSR